MAEVLDTLADPHTRKLATVVVDLNAGSPQPVRTAFIDCNSTTRFEIGSVTKALTGLLVAISVDRDEVALDCPVDQVVTELAGSAAGQLTLRQLCTHTTGLPGIDRTVVTFLGRYLFSIVGSNPYSLARPETIIRAARRAKPQAPAPYGYSNLGAALAGHVIARAADTDFSHLLQDRLARPLGLTNTEVSRRDTHSRGWRKFGRRSSRWVLHGYEPAGGVVSTAEDMSSLAVALLRGECPGISALSPVAEDRTAGLFWAISRVNGSDRTAVWHNGETGGFSAYLAIYPQAQRAVVVLSNVADASDAERVASGLARWLRQPRTAVESPTRD